jgi:Cft2 family RNA processing exonuclease
MELSSHGADQGVTGSCHLLECAGKRRHGKHRAIRLRHHLKHNLWNEHISVVFVGYAAQGTLARRIIDGAESVRVYSEDIPVRAAIHTIGGFSAGGNTSVAPKL